MRPEVAKPETDASREFVERADSRFRFPFGLSQPRMSEALGTSGCPVARVALRRRYHVREHRKSGGERE